MFRDNIDFQQAAFQTYVNFTQAGFHGDAGFTQTAFAGHAKFMKAMFERGAEFRRAAFLSGAGFSEATFAHDADFIGAAKVGSRGAEQQELQLSTVLTKQDDRHKLTRLLLVPIHKSQASRLESSRKINFHQVTFKAKVDFTDRVFPNATSFDRCRFLSQAPIFAETGLHQSTTWHDISWPSSPNELEDVRIRVDAYRNLRLRMKQIENYDQEILFLRMELDAKQRGHWLSHNYLRWLPGFLYQRLSNYGTSILRPIIGLSLMIY